MKAISLFAGAGGCSLGFTQCGVDIISAYDNAIPAINTYNLNFGQGKCNNVDLSTCNYGNIRNELGLSRGELDLIIGGPPCQGFTTAGTRFWDDPRNKLIRNYVDALDCFFPRWFFMENVEGILTTAKGEYVTEALKKMIRLGYSVWLKKVYAQEYGVPQRRKRVILVGNREGKYFSFPEPMNRISGSIFRKSSITLRDAIGDLEGKRFPDIDHNPIQENGIKLERILALKPGQSMKDLPIELQHDSFRRRANRRVCDGTPTEKRGGAPSGLKRLIYDEPSLTITGASITEFIHPIENRTLTLRECARIQTFPDDFSFCGTARQKIQQIGNAIPPILAAKMGLQIIECDNGKPNSVQPGLVEYDITKANAMSPILKRTDSLLNELTRNNYE